MLLQVLIAAASLFADTLDYTPPHRFQHPLYSPANPQSDLDLGNVQIPDSLERAARNMEGAGDLLSGDLSFHHPDYVTAGREYHLSPLGKGIHATRVLWRGRPFRDPWTGVADFSLLPLYYTGDVKSLNAGALDGVASGGGLVSMTPLQVEPQQPLTSLHHRDGYYGMAPVEFIHSRPISTGERGADITAGALIPSSQGRFEHAAYRGHIVYGDAVKRLGGNATLDVAYMNGWHNTQIAFTDSTRRLRREDLDLKYIKARGGFSASYYAVRQWVEYETSGSAADLPPGFRGGLRGGSLESAPREDREWGINLRGENGRRGWYLRAGERMGDLPGGRLYHLPEAEGSGTLKGRLGGIKWHLLAGFDGDAHALPAAIGSAHLASDAGALAQVWLTASHGIQRRAPRELFAGIKHNAGGVLAPDAAELDSMAAQLPATNVDMVELGGNRAVWLGRLEASAFYSREARPLLNILNPDSSIGWTAVGEALSQGWRARWKGALQDFRLSIGLLGFLRRGVGLKPGSWFPPEPNIRAEWELGWHKRHWEDIFEADLSLSGRYFRSYHAFVSGNSVKLGGAYPLDFRAGVRIFDFNLYWGVHNWNDFPYRLVPGYRMMHKEEYFGVNWLLIM